MLKFEKIKGSLSSEFSLHYLCFLGQPYRASGETPLYLRDGFLILET